MSDQYDDKVRGIFAALFDRGAVLNVERGTLDVFAAAMREAAEAAELRGIEKVRAEIAAKAMNAGQETGYCDTCASFEMTGWSMDTVNGVLDRLILAMKGHTFGKEGCWCRPTVNSTVNDHDAAAILTHPNPSKIRTGGKP